MTRPLDTPLPPLEDEPPVAWRCPGCGDKVGAEGVGRDHAETCLLTADDAVERYQRVCAEWRAVLVNSRVSDECRDAAATVVLEQLSPPWGDGVTEDEIAQATDLPVRVVRSRLARLRAAGGAVSVGLRPQRWRTTL